jgi:hypothetical protein
VSRIRDLLGRRWTPILVGLASFFAGIQLVPYGWSHSNPPVTADAPWPSAESERVARAACYDCHSNETHYPIYAYVAPMSWLVRHDIDDGRRKLNFSTWGQDTDIHDAADVVRDGSMPPKQFTILHPGARLSAEEKAALIAALERMDGGSDNSGKGKGGGSDDD